MVVAETGASAAQTIGQINDGITIEENGIVLEQNTPKPFRDQTAIRFTIENWPRNDNKKNDQAGMNIIMDQQHAVELEG